jgi:hypothetical protein
MGRFFQPNSSPCQYICLLTLYASITMAMATAPRIDSPKGTIGTQALFRAVDHADSRAFGNTYIATK